jgi:hypothetical protein
MRIELQVLLFGAFSILVTSWSARYFLLWRRKFLSSTQLFGLGLAVFLSVLVLLIIVGSTMSIAVVFSGVDVSIIIAYAILQRRTPPEQLAKAETRKITLLVIVGIVMFFTLYAVEGMKEALIAVSLYVLLAILYLWLRTKSTRAQ